MSIGILFSGQGAQKAGMGLDFFSDPLFKETIQTASEASKQNIEAIFTNKHEELSKTIHVQPALVAFELGIFRMLKRDVGKLDIGGMVGLSLGEYGAMGASNALDLASTISLVTDRASYMQADADKIDNAMAALIKPNLPKVEAILTQLQDQGKQVYLSNFNSPKQIVIGGEKDAVILASKKIKENEAAHRTILLNVNGAFHTPLFNDASKQMHNRLKDISFKPTAVPVISNTTGHPFTNDWAQIMERQLAVPTHFGDCLQYLIDHSHISATLEIGPGKTLSTFARQIDRSLKNYRIGTYDEYQEFIEEANGIKG
ncbi:ACP S-malonyltransferase [Lactobacillus sp. PV034]|uniref:ACP S-malonyltransferase n=1 Tax=Lactobacillus sp. PV034 TaxID=2594495 RepID=UPI0022406F77|nr:ACP S-malonyltransferase [Lactobacillus sp. PV034]QNQ80948.1 ACP S-malonyltransferase [Lactobacillus sp. PV034]